MRKILLFSFIGVGFALMLGGIIYCSCRIISCAEKSGLKGNAKMTTTSIVYKNKGSLEDKKNEPFREWVWKKLSNGNLTEGASQIVYNPLNNAFYASTKNKLYQFTLNQNAELIFNQLGKDEIINDIRADLYNSSSVFLATSQGMYIKEEGRHWKLSFHPSNSQTRNCLSLHISQNRIYLGTSQGLFVRVRGTGQWQRLQGVFNHSPIYHVVGDEKAIYFSTDNQVFQLDPQTQAIQKIFHVNKEQGSENEEVIYQNQISSMTLLKDQSLLIATSRGFFLSDDQGLNWRKFYEQLKIEGTVTGIIEIETSHGEDSPRRGNLIISSKRGAFFLTGAKVSWLYKGLSTNEIDCLAKDDQGNVYAGTDQGVFVLSVKKAQPVFNEGVVRNQSSEINEEKVGERRVLREPTIREVHQWVIEYADVSNRKIQTWRRKARKRAWFPKISMGVDGAKNKTVSDCVYGSYSQGGQSYIGPDDKSFYDNFGWDVSLTWDLADIVYTGEETSIDSRAKMMVELREEILDQVTRLYFERKRLQKSFIARDEESLSNPEETELRIEELTALIDSMTGGKFSEAINLTKVEGASKVKDGE